MKRIPLTGNLSKTQYEAVAYLAVGIWNTIFGVGLYTIAFWLFGKKVNYLMLAIPTNILAITNAFVCYKLLVFKTRGNWLKEYVKCYAVYGAGTLCGMGLLWLLASCLDINPAVANIISTVSVMIGSFFGHKFFSFKK